MTQASIEAALGGPVRQLPPVLDWGGNLSLSAFLGTTSGARQGVAPTNDRLYYLLGRPIGRVRVSNPTIEVVSGSAGTMARAGICEWDPVNEQPGALVVDWGTADTSSGGTKTFTNGAAFADLNPDKPYAKMFIGGGGTAAQIYYQPFSPMCVPIFAPGASQMVLSLYDSAESAQRTGGFNSPPSAAAALSVETSANAPGWRNWFQVQVEAIP